MDIISLLLDYMRKRQDKADYVEVNTPDVMDRSLWETSVIGLTIARTCFQPKLRMSAYLH